MKPADVWQMELWEYNAFIDSASEKQKNDMAQSILTGYYAAYYTNGGKKAKNPDELIRKLYAKKQSFNEGIRDIELIKAIEKTR